MKYYLCEVCGNLVELIEEGGGELVCCGQPMKELVSKETDEGMEKHLPVVEVNGSEVKVKVATPHQ
jgi:superoxide reductase